MKKQKISYKPLTKEEEEKIAQQLRENPPTKKDLAALGIALFIQLLPRVLLVLGIIFGLLWLMFQL